jgi:transposase-like protein
MITGERQVLGLAVRLSEAGALADAAFSPEHWRQITSNTALERLMKEIKRRTEAGGIVPNEAAIIRLVGANLLEQHEKW